MRLKSNFAEESSLSSSRFRRFFIRGSRDEIFEVGEEAVGSERDSAIGRANEANCQVDRSIRKSLSIGSLFAWRQRKSDIASTGESEEAAQTGNRSMQKRVLTALVESPDHGDDGRRGFQCRFKFKPSVTDNVGKPPVTVTSLSDGQDDESRKINFLFCGKILP